MPHIPGHTTGTTPQGQTQGGSGLGTNIGSSNLVGQYQQNLNQASTYNQAAMQQALTNAGATRQQEYGDMLGQSGLLGGTSGSGSTGALPTTVNYPTLNQPIHQGNFTGSMIGSVPIYAAPGGVPPVGIEQARRHKQLKNHLGTMKGTPDYSPMQVDAGYQERFNKKYFDEYNNWIQKAQLQEPMLWRQLMTDATQFGRDFKQWRLDTEDLGRSINSAVKVSQHIRGLDEKPGHYISDAQREISEKILAAVDKGTMDEMFKNPKGPLNLIKQLQVHSDIATVLKHELSGIQADIYSKINAGSITDIAGLGTSYEEYVKAHIEPDLDRIVDNIYRVHPYLEKQDQWKRGTGLKGEQNMKDQVLMYFGDKYKQHLIRETGGSGGKIAAPSRVFSNTMSRLDELSKYDHKALVGQRIPGANNRALAAKGTVGTTFIDKDGNINYVLNSDAVNMSQNIIGMFPDEIDPGTTTSDAMARVGNNIDFQNQYQNKFQSYFKDSIKPLYDALGLVTTASGTDLEVKSGFTRDALSTYTSQTDRDKIYKAVNEVGKESGGIGIGQGLILKSIHRKGDAMQFEVMGDDGRAVRGAYVPTNFLPNTMIGGSGTLSYMSATGEYTFIPGATLTYNQSENIFEITGATPTTAGAIGSKFDVAQILEPVSGGLSDAQETFKAAIMEPEYQADYVGQMNMLGLKNRGVEDMYNYNVNMVGNFRRITDLKPTNPPSDMKGVGWLITQNPNMEYGDVVGYYNGLSDTDKANIDTKGEIAFPAGNQDNLYTLYEQDRIKSYIYAPPKGMQGGKVQAAYLGNTNTASTAGGRVGTPTNPPASSGTQPVSSTTFSKAFDDEKHRSYQGIGNQSAYDKTWKQRVGQWDTFTGTLDEGIDQISVFEITKGKADGTGLSYEEWTKGGIAGYLPAGTDIGYTTDANGNQVPVDSPALQVAAKQYIQDNYMQVKDLNGNVVLDISTLPPAKALRILDMHINSEDPRASLLVAAGLLTVAEKKALYDGVYKTSTGKSKPNTKKVDALWTTHKAKVMNLLK